MSDEILEPELFDAPKKQADPDAWKKPTRTAVQVRDAEVLDVDDIDTRAQRTFKREELEQDGAVIDVDDFKVEYPDDYFKSFAWEEAPEGGGYQQVQTHQERSVVPGSTRTYKDIRDGWGRELEEWFDENPDYENPRYAQAPIDWNFGLGTRAQDFSDALDQKIAAPIHAAQERLEQTQAAVLGTLHEVATEVGLLRDEQNEERTAQVERRNRRIKLLMFLVCIAWMQLWNPVAQKGLQPKDKQVIISDQKCIRLSPPIDGEMTSPFGWRQHPIFGSLKHHDGVDYDANVGDPVRAAGIGKVVFTGNKGGYGKTVIIAHGTLLETLYAHNSELLVKVGQKVDQNTVIAKAGSTGNSTGPHLHFETRLGTGDNSKPVNPKNLIGKDYGKGCKGR